MNYIVNFDAYLDKKAGTKKMKEKEKDFEQFDIINTIIKKNNTNIQKNQ